MKGLALPLFAAAFNALLWLSQLTLGHALSALGAARLAMAVNVAAPLCLLAIMLRLAPQRRLAALGVASLSLCFANAVTG
ncbi:MAG: hypothetical protein JNK72_13480 [Myxococcales bacterium]|nr:hypothetical protein [Myxococcales bacterium]